MFVTNRLTVWRYSVYNVGMQTANQQEDTMNTTSYTDGQRSYGTKGTITRTAYNMRNLCRQGCGEEAYVKGGDCCYCAGFDDLDPMTRHYGASGMVADANRRTP